MRRRLLYLLPALLLLALDQWVKGWVRGNFALHESMDFVPNLVELVYVQNTGAAFSMLSAHTGFLALISTLAALAMAFVLLRGIFPKVWANLALSLVLGGAVGNLIDRVALGYVVDMFSLQFMNFAVFNVADIGVTLGGIAFCIYIAFFWQKSEKPTA